MSSMPGPPDSYMRFINRYPKLDAAWQAIREQGDEGPLDERTQRLIRIALAIGSANRGAVFTSVKKGLAVGVSPEEIEQVVALAAGNLGLPATATAYGWVREVIERTMESQK